MTFKAPTDPVQNLKFRKWVWAYAAKSDKNRRVLLEYCKRDPVFFVNTFIWANDPRQEPANNPFILYPKQEQILLQMLACTKNEIVLDKSRDEGGTYLVLILNLIEFLFICHDTQWLLLSRKEDLVDQPNDPTCLFGKLDYMLSRLPLWIYNPGENLRMRMSLYGNERRNLITGESTNPNAGRGRRFRRVLADEWAVVPEAESVATAIQGATDCVIFLSTPRGKGNHFYLQTLRDDVLRCRIHWTDNPKHAEGLYYDENGKPRSPYYDRQCKRYPPMIIRSEYDIDYEGSDYRFFPDEFIRLLAESGVEPVWQGEVDFDSEFQKIVFVPRPDGQGALKLWIPLENFKKLSLVVGSDISMGTGASNSVATWVDRETGRMVAEYCTSRSTPDVFVRKVNAVCTGFQTEKINWIWENNGPGRIFGSKLTDMGSAIRLAPTRYYLHREELKLSHEVSELPGWASSKDGKLKLMEDWREAVVNKRMIVTSKEIHAEAGHYIWDGEGSPKYVDIGGDIDPSGAKKNHGDRVMATAIAWQYCTILGSVRKETEKKVIPVNSIGYRMQQIEDEDDD